MTSSCEKLIRQAWVYKISKYVKDGKLFEARAKKAIVLAGGINNSKILQLFGIGPAAALQKAGSSLYLLMKM